MDVYQAVDQRTSVRAFTDRKVDRAVIDRVLRAASRSPSGGNLQPWKLYVLTGEPLAKVKHVVGQRVAGRDAPDVPEYPIYPAGLTSPYRDRRFACGELLYAALGIPREDKGGRLRQFAHNFEFFGAPVGAFCYIDRQMGRPQWADVGMYLQTVMLLLEAEGLSSCAQEAWSIYHRSIAEVVQPPDELMLFPAPPRPHPGSAWATPHPHRRPRPPNPMPTRPQRHPRHRTQPPTTVLTVGQGVA